MSDIQIGNPHNVWLLVVIAAGLLATAYAIVVRRRAVGQFSTATARTGHTAASRRHWLSAGLVAACLTLLFVSLLDIRWGKTWREVPQKGIEVMFVLDVSRSMLAEDASPNRLTRAKQQIKDMLDEMAGDRVGLVVFAGDTRQVVPLTSHYEDFKQMLDSVGPHSVRLGGSRLGEALTAAANGFISKTNEHRAIVVFTDGEDQQSQPVERAKQLYADQGIRIFTVGLGDMDHGARIPESESKRGEFLEYEGQQVWSKMNGQILRQIATDTRGAYIPAGTKRVNMGDVYHGYIANVEQQEFETAKINAYIPRFQWFAVPALALLVLEVLVSTQRTKSRVRPNDNSSAATTADKRLRSTSDTNAAQAA
ncbi:MAG: VWA domain-containing protein [Planctomycetales bacterium]|nr:VWA domain-containing protein [Planctomycetales bacterium]